MAKRAANAARAARFVRDHGLGRPPAVAATPPPAPRASSAAAAATAAGAVDVRSLTADTGAFARLVVCTALSARHARAIADEVSVSLRACSASRPVVRDRRAEWVVVDAGDEVVHVLTEEMRAQYALEELWGEGAGAGAFPYGGGEEEEVG